MKLAVPPLLLCAFCTSAALAGGWNSGGGSGVATYSISEGAQADPKPESLLRVEILSLYNARHSGRLNPVPTLLGDPGLDEKVNAAVAEVLAHIASVDPEVAHALGESVAAFNLSIKILRGPDTAASARFSKPIAPIFDFGKMPHLRASEKWVQIVQRKTPNFYIDLRLLDKMGFEDRVALALHEAAYAVSHDPDSTRIQNFELFWIEHLGSQVPSSEITKRLAIEWGIQLAKSPQALQLPAGVEIFDENLDRPYDGPFGINSLNLTNLGDGPTGQLILTPYQSKKGLICGSITGINPSKNRVSFHVIKNLNDQKTWGIDLTSKDWNRVENLWTQSRKILTAKINRYETPGAIEATPFVCFDLVLNSFPGRRVRFLEFHYFIQQRQYELSTQTAGLEIEIQALKTQLEALRSHSDSSSNDILRYESLISEVDSWIEDARRTTEAKYPTNEYALMHRLAFSFDTKHQ